MEPLALFLDLLRGPLPFPLRPLFSFPSFPLSALFLAPLCQIGALSFYLRLFCGLLPLPLSALRFCQRLPFRTLFGSRSQVSDNCKGHQQPEQPEYGVTHNPQTSTFLSLSHA